MNGISLSTMGQMVFQMVGPALAGFLIEAYDFALIYYLMTAMYIMAPFSPPFYRVPVRQAHGGVIPWEMS